MLAVITEFYSPEYHPDYGHKSRFVWGTPDQLSQYIAELSLCEFEKDDQGRPYLMRRWSDHRQAFFVISVSYPPCEDLS